MNKYLPHCTSALIIFCALLGCLPQAIADESEPTTITLPIELDLAIAQKHVQSVIKPNLANISKPTQVCVEATWFKTKGVPKCTFKGIKLYCKDSWIKTKATPDIKCSIDGWVRRTGPVVIRSSSNVISASMPLAASVSAKDIGGLIKSETAEAKAIVSANATIDLDENWNPKILVNPSYTWTQSPTLKLFDLIPITLKSVVEPELKKILKAEQKKLPSHLAKLRLRESIESLWLELQNPIEISANPKTYLRVMPETAIFSGFNTEGNKVKTKVQLVARTTVEISDSIVPIEKIPLPKLQKRPIQTDTFKLKLPVVTQLSVLQNAVNAALPDGMTLPLSSFNLDGGIKVSNIRLSGNNNMLSVKVHVDRDTRGPIMRFVDIFDWFAVNGDVTLSGRPIIKKDSRSVELASLEIESNTENKWFNQIAELANLGILEEYVKNRINYDFSNDADRLIKNANESIDFNIKNLIKVDGKISTFDAESVEVVDQEIIIQLKAAGQLIARTID